MLNTEYYYHPVQIVLHNQEHYKILLIKYVLVFSSHISLNDVCLIEKKITKILNYFNEIENKN